MSTLENIEQKVRQLTGRKSTAQLSQTALRTAINDYYQNEFPQELKLFNLREQKRFALQPNVSLYDVNNQPTLLNPNNFYSVEPPAYCDQYPVYWSENLNEFYGYWPRLRQQSTVATGNGLAAYSGTIPSTPILPQSLAISAATGFNTSLTAFDDGAGLLVPSTGGASIGNVNYETGVFSLTFASAIPSGNSVVAHYYPYETGRPLVALWYDNKLTLYPVPDEPYEFTFVQYVTPTALLSGQSPELNRWWQAIAYGTAMKIFENNKDIESRNEMEQLLDRQLVLTQRQTWNTLQDQRTATIYQGPSGSDYVGGNYFGFIPGIR